MSTDRVGLKLQVDIDVLQWFAKQGDYRERMALVLRRHVDEMLEIEAAVAGVPIVTRATVERAEKDRLSRSATEGPADHHTGQTDITDPVMLAAQARDK